MAMNTDSGYTNALGRLALARPPRSLLEQDENSANRTAAEGGLS
jgi:hypothetical protein